MLVLSAPGKWPMRILPIVLLLAWLAVSSCDDTGGPSQDGRLVISTATDGEAPDQNGYLLTVDDLDTLALAPGGTAGLDVPPGAHVLGLLGVAPHCSVAPGATLEVRVAPAGTTPVNFAIHCPATGVRVSMTTTGLDFDPNGYRVTVDGVDWAGVGANGAFLVQVAPGERMIALTDLTPNCELEGSQSQTVTIVYKQVLPLELAAVCTAAAGVVGVTVVATGADIAGTYEVTVDERHYPVQVGKTYLSNVAPGERVVTLVPPANCSAETEPQSITLTAGGMVRDTAEVSFAVSCEERLATLRITASTSGTPSPYDYSVLACVWGDFYCDFYSYSLGALDPNGTLLAQVPGGSYEIWLEGVPVTCAFNGPSFFTVADRDTLDLRYVVSCP